MHKNAVQRHPFCAAENKPINVLHKTGEQYNTTYDI